MEEVKIKKIEKIPDERGKILNMLHSDNTVFRKFWEMYLARMYPSVVKGWNIHRKMTLNFAIQEGKIKLLLHDNQTESRTKEELEGLFIGKLNYELVLVSLNVRNGFKRTGTKSELVTNCSTELYSSKEIESMDPVGNGIPYGWSIRRG
ncbi:hypothetical protein ApAK_04025 [Thermoplasmatales archaeon AK]|nr:hypothetical protein [Thermoplasmatales archaeon AK]